MSFLSARAKAGISQAKVAETLGVTDSAVCQWETGKTVPRLPLLLELAKLYGVSVNDLLADNENNTN